MRPWKHCCLVLMSAACGRASAGPPSVRSDSAGVEIVTSPSRDRPLAWRLEERFRLGGREGGPEAFFALNVLDVGSDGRGHIFVLNEQVRRIEVFDSTGRFLREMGAQGEGPGELSSPGSMAVERSGTVSVFDYGKHVIVRYDSSGSPQPEIRITHYPPPVLERQIALLGNRLLSTSMMPGAQERTMRTTLLAAGPVDTTVLAEVVPPPSNMVRYDRCGGGLNLPPLFAPQISWDVGDSALAVSSFPDYRIDVIRLAPAGTPHDLTLSRSVRRPLALRAATRDMALQELGDGFKINFGHGPCTIRPAEMVDGRGFGAQLPWIRRIALDRAGQLWVERKVPGPDATGPIDLFDASGAYLGTLPVGTPFPIAFLSATRLAWVVRDELDVQRLVIADIVRAPIKD